MTCRFFPIYLLIRGLCIHTSSFLVSQVVLSGVGASWYGICGIGWRFDIPLSTNVVQAVATSMVSAFDGAARGQRACFSPVPGIHLAGNLAHLLCPLMACK